ncbi:MAG: hypothetical protein WD852_00905 [Methyloceanibacter sp.]
MAEIELHYAGEKISEQNGMAANDVADSIEGFADFLYSITRAAYGAEVEVKLIVRTAKPGSFDIQFLYEVGAVAYTIVSAIGADSIADLIRQSFDLLKHLKGEPPKSVKTADRGSVFVENNAGQIIVVNQPVIHAVVDGRAGNGAEKFARRPLQHEAEELDVLVDGKVAAKADRRSANFLVPISKGDTLNEFVSDQFLTIRTVVLEGDGQWRFSDGKNSFRAVIDDRGFLQRVKEGKERFGRGDILRVRLRSKQEKVRGQLRTTHMIEEVLSHEP